MRTVKALVPVAVILLAVCLVRAEPPEGEAVMDKLTDVFRGMRDLAADVEVHTRARQASGNIVLQYVPAEPETPGEGDRTIRKYIIVTRVKVADGVATIKQVNDGKYLWVERRMEATGEVKVVRRRVPGEGPVPGGFGPDWRREIDVWRGKFAFRTLRSETFDEEPVAVVEGTRKQTGEDDDAKEHPGLSLPDRMVLFVSTRDSFPRKVDFFSKPVETAPAGQRDTLTVSVRLMHVKLNEGLKPDTFRYTVPPGAEFIDVK